MLRALGLAAALLVVGCGDDTTTGASTDLSQPVLDLSQPPAPMCGISICTGTCSACLPLGGGVCVPPCMTAVPASCTAPASCHPLGNNPDAGGATTLAGDCAGYDGYCG
ncbi:MAG: hypothetical protein ACXVDD_19660 [Polyangia bacterium]